MVCGGQHALAVLSSLKTAGRNAIKLMHRTTETLCGVWRKSGAVASRSFRKGPKGSIPIVRAQRLLRRCFHRGRQSLTPCLLFLLVPPWLCCLLHAPALFSQPTLQPGEIRRRQDNRWGLGIVQVEVVAGSVVAAREDGWNVQHHVVVSREQRGADAWQTGLQPYKIDRAI
jgi:hypothetical protein